MLTKFTSNEIVDNVPRVGVLLSQISNFHIDFNHFM